MLPKKALEVLKHSMCLFTLLESKWQHHPSSLSLSQITHHISANNFHIWLLRLINRLPPVWGAFEALWGHIIKGERVGLFFVSGMLIWENGTGTWDSFVWNSEYIYNRALGLTYIRTPFSFPVLSIPSSHFPRVFIHICLIIFSLPSPSLLFLWRGHGNLINVSYTTVKKKVKAIFMTAPPY